MLPRVTNLRQPDTHRLVPVQYATDQERVFARLADEESRREELSELERASDARFLGEAGLLAGISIRELVFGIPNQHIINAAFTHARPAGGRFNGPDRGAWYAALILETAQAEVAFHKSAELQEVGWQEEEVAVYVDYLADFHADFHDLRRNPKYASCLRPDSYVSSQKLARDLLNAGSAGVIYPSVRHSGGTCLACFRPALVTNVRMSVKVKFTFAGGHNTRIQVAKFPPRGARKP